MSVATINIPHRGGVSRGSVYGTVNMPTAERHFGFSEENIQGRLTSFASESEMIDYINDVGGYSYT